MAKTQYLQLHNGNSKRETNRYGGEKREGHDTYGRTERAKALARVMDADFATIRREMLTVREPESVWTVLEPESGKFRTRIYIIEGDAELATRVYAARNNGRHPSSVGCDCGCGSDYFLTEHHSSLRVATARVRRCDVAEDCFGTEYTLESGVLPQLHDYLGRRREPSRWDYQPLDFFLAREDVELIRDADIQPHERDFPIPPVTGPWDYTEDQRAIAWLLDLQM